MGTNAAKTEVDAHAPLLVALVYSAAAFVLMELWLLGMGAGLRAHGLAALFGLWPIVLCIRRPRIGRRDLSRHEHAARQRHGFRTADAGRVLVLLLVGAILGMLVLRAGTVALGIAAVGLSFAPWQRVDFCRKHFLLASTTMLTGMLSVMAVGYRSILPMFLPIACWIFWASAGIALLWRIEKLSRAERLAKIG